MVVDLDSLRIVVVQVRRGISEVTTMRSVTVWWRSVVLSYAAILNGWSRMVAIRSIRCIWIALATVTGRRRWSRMLSSETICGGSC